MHEIVINTCYGGYGVSPFGLVEWYKRKNPGSEVYLYKTKYYTDTVRYEKTNSLDGDVMVLTKDLGEYFTDASLITNDIFISEYGIKRTDPILIKLIEEFGSLMNGEHAELFVAKVDSNKYRICEYDGLEWIETPESIEWNTFE